MFEHPLAEKIVVWFEVKKIENDNVLIRTYLATPEGIIVKKFDEHFMLPGSKLDLSGLYYKIPGGE